MALTDKLSAIGVAIRQKTGSSALMTLDEMPGAIASITTGGGGGSADCNGLHIPEDKLALTGSCGQKFSKSYGGWDWFYNEYKDKITTQNLYGVPEMFLNSDTIEEIPTDFYFGGEGQEHNLTQMFMGCYNLKTISGKLYNIVPVSLSYMFSYCRNLRYLPEFVNCDWDRLRRYTSGGIGTGFFEQCYSLRSIPEEVLSNLYQEVEYSWDSWFHMMFINCYALDEIRGLRVPTQYEMVETNMFTQTFDYCNRVKEIIFATQEDGTPYTAKMSNQIIDLTQYVGWVSNFDSNETKLTSTTFSNSGITKSKKVTSKTSYNNLKNDPDWYTLSQYYSRYNHDSAVNTINSLPDTSEFLATRDGETNTINFLGSAGESTDGGAINTLTEEEIAVATAKGWTVSLS